MGITPAQTARRQGLLARIETVGLSRAEIRKRANRLAQQDDYLTALGKVGTQAAALKVAHATTRNLYEWREEDAEFVERERDKKAEIADALEAEAIRRAKLGVKKPVYQGGLLAGYVTEYSDNLLIMLLKAHKPEKFRERSEITLNPIVKVVAGFEPSDVV